MGMRETPTQRTMRRRTRGPAKSDSDDTDCDHDWGDWTGGGYKLADTETGESRTVITADNPTLCVYKRQHRTCQTCGEHERRRVNIGTLDVTETEDGTPETVDVRGVLTDE